MNQFSQQPKKEQNPIARAIEILKETGGESVYNQEGLNNNSDFLFVRFIYKDEDLNPEVYYGFKSQSDARSYTEKILPLRGHHGSCELIDVKVEIASKEDVLEFIKSKNQ